MRTYEVILRHMKMVLVFFCVILALSPAYAAYAPADDPSEGGGNARLLGLGEAYTAISDDPNAVFINPAGLGNIKSLELTGMYYTKVFGTMYYLTGAGAIPTSYGTFGLGYVGSGTSGIPVTDLTSVVGVSDYSNNVFLVSYGTALGRFYRDLRRFSVGASLKLFNRGFSGTEGNLGAGANIDLGLKFFVSQWLTLGLSKANILPSGMGGGIRWTTGLSEDLTSPTRLGAALRLFDGRQIVGLDVSFPSDVTRPTLFGLGTEYNLDKNLFLRGGLSGNIDAASSAVVNMDPSLGLGFRYESMKIDYAYRPYLNDSSNATHYISLSFEEDIEKALKIKIGRIDEGTSPDIYELPGKVYDDLGNMVKGAQTYYHPGTYWNPELSALNSLTPVKCEIVDYDTLLAYAFTDIRYAKEEQSPKKYFPGDLLPLLVEAPYDIDTIVAGMPNGDQVKLVYDEKADAWYGIWRVPKGMKSGLYRAKIYATDFEGAKVTSDSTPFFLEGLAVGGVGTPETPVTSAPVKEQPKVEAAAPKPVEAETPKTIQVNVDEQEKLEAQAKAEEKARIEAQKKANEEAAKLEAQRKAEEQAKLEAQRKADEQARLEAQKKADEQARLEAQKKLEAEKAAAEEKARIEAQKKAEAEAKAQAEAKAGSGAKAKAEEQARLDAQRTAEEQAKLEAQRKADEQARLEAQKKTEEQAKIEEAKSPESVKTAKVESGIGGPTEAEIIGITVTSPQDRTEIYKALISVSGFAGKEIVNLEVNGVAVKVGKDLKFSAAVPLSLGKNTIIVEGTTKDLSKAMVQIRVLRLGLSVTAPAAEVNRIKSKPAEEKAIMTIIYNDLKRSLGLSDPMRRSEAAVILSDLADLNRAPVTEKPFKDVSLNSLSVSHIASCKTAGLLRGYPDGNFKPNNSITFAEFSALILRTAGISHPKPEGASKYWASGVISKIKELGLVEDAQARTESEFRKAAVFEDMVHLIGKTRQGSEKAGYLLDFDRGY